MQTCRTCKVEKPLGEFHMQNTSLGIRKTECKRCHYFYKIKRNFGLTQDQYDILYERQNGLCAICKQVCSSGRLLAVDHDHATGRVRGLLCGNCNKSLGGFKDNTELLRRAITYLEEFN